MTESYSKFKVHDNLSIETNITLYSETTESRSAGCVITTLASGANLQKRLKSKRLSASALSLLWVSIQEALKSNWAEAAMKNSFLKSFMRAGLLDVCCRECDTQQGCHSRRALSCRPSGVTRWQLPGPPRTTLAS